jgi:DNA-directed RNA polymerase subunit RPC12/RpoP
MKCSNCGQTMRVVNNVARCPYCGHIVYIDKT